MLRVRPVALASLAALVTVAAVIAGARPARACGGTFCDVGPMDMPNMPVDQTGETILFVLDGDHTEAHIQIEYDPDTDAQTFAWLVPVTALPEFSVGSQQLFLNLLNSTVPSFGYMTTVEPCDPTASASASASDGGCTSTTSGGTTSTSTSEGTTAEPPPEVLLRDTVGAFNVVVLEAMEAEPLMQWLGDNGFYQDPKAAPILQEYIDEGYLFVALGLRPDAEVAEIHPITLTYPGDEPCVPLRLTRIAAKQDMDVRIFFLADDRVGPSAPYRHVVVNDVRQDWADFVGNYKEVVSLAVDEAPADGHAFVTEYAAASSVVDQSGLFSATWASEPFAAAAAIDVYALLKGQGLMECEGGVCLYNHPLLQGILGQFLPVPDGLSDGDFYGCLECFEALIDEGAYDPAGLALAIQGRIIDPGAHAIDLLETWPTLTRLYTTISPEEMTVDPFFHENEALPAVDLRAVTADRSIPCFDTPTWTLPSGRLLRFFGLAWPDLPAAMPHALRVETIPPVGPPQVDLDNGDLIDELLAVFNAAQGSPPQASCHTGGHDTSESATESATETGSASASATDSATSSTGGQAEDSSCACRSDDVDPLGPAALVVAVAGVVGRRRRRGPDGRARAGA